MAEIKHTAINQKSYKLPIVGRWHKAGGYDMHLVDISFPMFDINFIVSFGKMAEAARYLRDRYDYILEDYESAIAMCVTGILNKKDNGRANHLIFTTNDWTAKDYGTIAHETHHAVHKALGNIGLDYGVGGEELFAYMQGHMMELIVRAFQELRNTLSKQKPKKKHHAKKK